MDPRLRASVDASVCWYDDLFAVHGIGATISDGIWFGHAPPPALHSAAKTVEPWASAEQVLPLIESFAHCTVADSFGTLDLEADGMTPMFAARWLHHPPLEVAPPSLPSGWEQVTDPDALAEWTGRHDSSDVLLPALLDRARFRVLARRDHDELLGGAVTHLCAGVVSLSNVWAEQVDDLDWVELVRLVHALHPGRAVVGYEFGEHLERALAAGFADVGPHLVWVR